MSGRSKQTFFQRRHTDDQEAHEKMLSITNCYRNEKQNHSKISSHSSLNAHKQKKKKKSTNSREHPGGPVVRILGFHCQGLSSILIKELRSHRPCGEAKKKSLQTINTGEGMEKGEPSYTVARNENQYNHYREQCGGSLKH